MRHDVREQSTPTVAHPAPGQRPIRVLHLLKAMDRAGVETWLMNILRTIDRTQFQMDFAVETAQPAPYDDEARALGSRVMPCADPHQPWRYARAFRRILREHGPYDIVHSHGRHYNGFVLWLAQREGVPLRIAHSHNDTYARQAYRIGLRPLYLAATKRWIGRYRTVGLACSEDAAVDLFGSRWASDAACRVLYCGIDLDPFSGPVNRAEVRAEFDIPEDALVIGNVGRFTPQKNHAFLLEVAAQVATRQPNLRVLLVGVGALRAEVEEQATRLGIADRVIYAGSRTDVPRLLRGAMDVFLFPSLFEGLGLAFVEAQAAGLPCVISDVVPREADVVAPVIRRLPLAAPASAWAEAVLAAHSARRTVRPEEALAIMKRSPFDVQVSRQQLEHLYMGLVAGHSPPEQEGRRHGTRTTLLIGRR